MGLMRHEPPSPYKPCICGNDTEFEEIALNVPCVECKKCGIIRSLQYCLK